MSKRNLTIIAGIIVALIVGWAVFRPELLFISKTVDESFPGSNGSSAQTVLASGSFYGVAHETKGQATIYRVVDSKRVVRLSNFETSNGPDVRVFLAAAGAPKDNDAVSEGGYVSLGAATPRRSSDVFVTVTLHSYRLGQSRSPKTK